jgi:hypothetical protein
MRACAHFVRLPLFLPANSKEQAGRSQGFHNHVGDPRDIVMKPPRNGRAKAWYPYILESCGVHCGNISNITEIYYLLFHLGFTVLNPKP